MKPVRIGCSGWAYKEWRGELYPQKLPQREWLRRYAETFDTVEINSTFYRLPTDEAVKGWIEQTPSNFVFTVKGSRYFTHVKRMLHPEQYLERFFDQIAPLDKAGRLGAVLWQLAPSFKADLGRLGAALAELDRRPGRHCFEFRHPSWYAQPTYDLLGEHGAALVIADDSRWPFRTRDVTADWIYIRFHRGSRGNYTKAELATWRRRIAAWRSEREVLAYFNNDEGGQAHRNARALAASFSVKAP